MEIKLIANIDPQKIEEFKKAWNDMCSGIGTTFHSVESISDDRPTETNTLKKVIDSIKGNDTTPIEFNYKNWQGEIADRNVIPIEVYLGSTEYHPKEQWLLRAFDIDKKAERVFAVNDIIELYK